MLGVITGTPFIYSNVIVSVESEMLHCKYVNPGESITLICERLWDISLTAEQ